MSLIEDKKALRARLKEIGRSLDPDYIKRSDEAILKCVMDLKEYREAKCIFAFVSFGFEADTHEIIKASWESGKRVVVPKCEEKGQMSLYEIKSFGDLVPGAYGIMEPGSTAGAADISDIDFALIPCLSCSSRGERLGRGGGYYDRFLERFRGNSAMLVRKRLMCEDIPMEPHDAVIKTVISD